MFLAAWFPCYIAWRLMACGVLCAGHPSVGWHVVNRWNNSEFMLIQPSRAPGPFRGRWKPYPVGVYDWVYHLILEGYGWDLRRCQGNPLWIASRRALSCSTRCRIWIMCSLRTPLVTSTGLVWSRTALVCWCNLFGPVWNTKATIPPGFLAGNML